MFTRLCVLCLLVVAIVSTATPAQASTLSITGMTCNVGSRNSEYGNTLNFNCWAGVSGGTGSYTSYVWYMEPTSFPTSGPQWTYMCTEWVTRTISLTVTDSAGATAVRSTTLYCDYN